MKKQNKVFETVDWENPDVYNCTNGQQVFAERAISNVFSRCGLEVPSNIHLLASKCLSAAIEVAGPNPSDLDIQMEFRRLVETIESQH